MDRIYLFAYVICVCFILHHKVESHMKSSQSNDDSVLDSYNIFCKDKVKKNFCSDQNTKFVMKFKTIPRNRLLKDVRDKDISMRNKLIELNAKKKLESEQMSQHEKLLIKEAAEKILNEYAEHFRSRIF